MRRFHRKNYRWLRYIPRRKHLRNGWLHRILGDRLFAPELWLPNRRGIAGGLALGLFIGFTPTMGVQIILCGVLAYLLRVNIPLALAGTFVTNPFTAAIIYPLEYQVGVWLAGVPSPSELSGATGPIRAFALYAKPLWIGSVAVGSVAAFIAYVAAMLLWKEAAHLRDALHRKHPDSPDNSESNRPSVPQPEREPLSPADRPTKEHRP
ncbi:MAG: DUF2062 domain-containing protein [Verrucomicrobiaceae bacterium]|nr:MAG: DUF2062 domain-containing protein [Verrucomicrobiaceae bacterium]